MSLNGADVSAIDGITTYIYQFTIDVSVRVPGIFRTRNGKEQVFWTDLCLKTKYNFKTLEDSKV